MSRTASLALVAFLPLVLAACAAPDTVQTLAQTKSPVQLLRNEVASRLPAELVLAAENEDFSEACGEDASVRAWHSSVTLDIDTSGETDGTSSAVDAAVDQLSASFEEDGWVSTPGNDRLDYKQAYFTGGVPGVQIQVSVPPPAGAVDQLYINVFGACVQTDGPDSDEVASLEGLS